ncbi:alpha/beta fold hydrolase [Dyadobacter sp. CY107]|uniref:alpha/beta fold hydrolase n=1 Tax=Dyadobacter fanqingshengii TaxID=2906443 RepID=UPI001F1CF5CF|nr:alpha/beta fold hydrolase [Dyadobacter fanqingshengii]MCF2502102.1 alpha/beta fold hydrolase [Dyadobacter fanqingshengii]
MKFVNLPIWATSLLLSLLLISCSEDHAPQASTKTYLLVHGASHGAWAWKKVVPLLQAQGHRVVAIDLPGHGDDKTPAERVTLDDYVNKVVNVANAQAGPVILVGHSAGGVSIAQAAERLETGKVEKLIFLDAFLPKSGESVFSLAAKFLPPSTTGEPNFSDNFLFDPTGATFTLDTARVANFLYHDCSAADVLFAKANLGRQPVAPFATPVQLTDTKYGTIPKYFIICSQAKNGDMTAMAKNVVMNKVVTLSTSHSPFFSQPKALTELILSF